MALDTYTNLKLAVADWLHRSDLTSQIVDFISLAEEKMWHDLRVREMENDTTVSTTSRTVALPTGLLEIRRAYINTNPPKLIKFMSPEQIMNNYNASNGEPKYYTIVGSNIQFERTPDSSYSVYLQYYKKLTALSGSNATNDILTYYPSVYLFGTLLQAAAYMVDDIRVPLWEQKYRDAVDMANYQAVHGSFGNGLAVQAV